MGDAVSAPVARRIEDFVTDYAHCLDDGEFEAWPQFFDENAHYQIISRESFEAGLPIGVMHCDGRGMFKDRISALREANIFEPHVYCHMVSALKIIDASETETRTQSNFYVTRTMPDGEMTTFLCGKVLDTIVEIDGELKFKERKVILDSRRIDTLLVIPV